MFDVVHERPRTRDVDGKAMIVPVESHGVKLLSIGFFAAQDQAIVWRGPMASKALEQLFKDADWGELDLLLVDLPPGTGDIHLSLVQAVPLTGAAHREPRRNLWRSPMHRKGVGMFRLPSVNVPVLGIVENMAWFTPEELENKYYIFGKGGARALAEELQVPFLGEVPLVQSIREADDVGRPAVLQGNTPSAKAFNDLCTALQQRLTQPVLPLAVKPRPALVPGKHATPRAPRH